MRVTVYVVCRGAGGVRSVLPPGQVGEVCIRGANVTAGYLNNPKANEEAFAGGWFHTGDQGVLDEQVRGVRRSSSWGKTKEGDARSRACWTIRCEA